MLYSGAWEQPTNTSGAARDKPGKPPTRGHSASIALRRFGIHIKQTSYISIKPQSSGPNLLDEGIDQYLRIG